MSATIYSFKLYPYALVNCLKSVESDSSLVLYCQHTNRVRNGWSEYKTNRLVAIHGRIQEQIHNRRSHALLLTHTANDRLSTETIDCLTSNLYVWQLYGYVVSVKSKAKQSTALHCTGYDYLPGKLPIFPKIPVRGLHMGICAWHVLRATDLVCVWMLLAGRLMVWEAEYYLT